MMQAAPAMAESTVISGTIPLVVSGVSVSPITTTSATISWTTNGNSTSQVFYALSSYTDLGNYTPTVEDTSLVTSHSVTLTSLTSGTTYHYIIFSAIPTDGLEAITVDSTFTTLTTSTPTPTPTPPPSGGGGGGGGGGAPTITGIGQVSWYTSAVGIVSSNVELKSQDLLTKLTLTQGTTVTDGKGHAQGNLTCTKPSFSPPVPPEKNALVIHNFGPSGATFNPAATITVYYDVSKIPEGVSESSLTLVYWDADGNQWLELSNIVVNTETQQISGKTTHLTLFALFCNSSSEIIQVPSGTILLGDSVGADGKVIKTIVAKCLESAAPKVLSGATMTIPEGTLLSQKDGKPLSSLSMVEMTNPPAWPEKKVIVGLPYNFGPDGATFSQNANLTISYNPSMLTGVVSEEDLVIAYYDTGLKKWVELPSVLNKEKHTITAQVAHFTAFTVLSFIITPPPVALPGQVSFDVISMTVMPPEVNPGENVDISAQIFNPGKISGYCNVKLLVNDVIESTVEVMVPAGGYKLVAFTTSKSVSGAYSVKINQLTRSFLVKDIGTVPAVAPKTPDWWFYLSIALWVVTIGTALAAIFIWLKKHKIIR
jgi:hypothetical protein